jgi:hypothetical protein
MKVQKKGDTMKIYVIVNVDYKEPLDNAVSLLGAYSCRDKAVDAINALYDGVGVLNSYGTGMFMRDENREFETYIDELELDVCPRVG